MDYKTLFAKTKDITLLLVEDYEPLRNDMTEALENLFKTVVAAVDGREALHLYQQFYETQNKHFDLVITDIQMPFMNGVDLSATIQELRPEQQIIVLSAHTDSEYLLKLINLGIAQFITKPIDHGVLMSTLYSVCDKIDADSPIVAEEVVVVDLGKGCIWNTATCLLQQNEKNIALTRHELLLIQMMIRKSHQICTNEDIMNDFYTNNIEISEASIRNMVYKLRKKLPQSAIDSIYGLGYKLIPVN